MIKHYLGLLLALCVAAIANLSAQEFSVNGYLRPRMEYRSGYKKPLADNLTPSFVTTNLSRLQFDFAYERVRMRVTLQDSRIWGAQPITGGGNLSFYEGWAEVDLCKGLSLKVGRQTLNFDYGRLFNADSWTRTGKSHDVARLTYKFNNGLTTEAAFAINHASDTNSAEADLYNESMNLYQKLGLVRLSHTIDKQFKLSAIWVGEQFQNYNDTPENYGRHTFGANFEWNNTDQPLSVILTVYGQQGKSRNKLYTIPMNGNEYAANLSALFVAGRVNYDLNPNSRLFVATDFYSGSKNDLADDKDKTWNKLYGSNHGFNGHIDFFTTLPKQGLLDLYLGIEQKWAQSKWKGELTYHHFATQHELDNTTTNKSLGDEIDIKLQYKMLSYVSFEMGYAMYFSNDNLRKHMGVSPDTRLPQWAYVSMLVNPQLFSSKK